MTEPVPRPHFPLRDAVLCLDDDCQAVFTLDSSGTCPACGAMSWAPLSAWLNPAEVTR